MSKLIVDTSAIATAAGDINRLVSSIGDNVAQLRGRLGALSGAWEGPAKVEFDRVMAEFMQLQGKVNENLGNISSLTNRASAAYADHEQQTRALFSH